MLNGRQIVCITDDVALAAAVSAALAGSHSVSVITCSQDVLSSRSADVILAGVDAVGMCASSASAVVGLETREPRRAGSIHYCKDQPDVAAQSEFLQFILPRDSDALHHFVGGSVTTNGSAQESPRSADEAPSRLIVVCNSVGGAGASSLAWMLALTPSEKSRFLIEGDVRSPGLDVWVGAESQRGSRWPDIIELRESIDVGDVERNLIAVTDNCFLLSNGRDPQAPEWEPLSHILSAINAADVVCDLSGATQGPFADAVLSAASDVVIVTPATVLGCAAAVTLVRRIGPLRTRLSVAVSPTLRALADETLMELLQPDSLVHLPADTSLARRLQERDLKIASSPQWRDVTAALLHGEQVSQRRVGRLRLGRRWL